MQETKLEVGAVLEGTVTGITNFGAFVDIGGGKTGMVHISEVAPVFVKEIRDFVKEGQKVRVRVINLSEDGKISLSIKKADENAQQQRPRLGGQIQAAAYESGPARSSAVLRRRAPHRARQGPAITSGTPGRTPAPLKI